ncbi:major surface protein 3 [Burkholderia pseudomallei 305]|nr:major surface protein 3 [Burkholderia pseudomallei 305]
MAASAHRRFSACFHRAGTAAFSTIFVGKLVDRLSIGHSTP